jgi:alpha-beta hydrolase superfamily lysophospholipase
MMANSSQRHAGDKDYEIRGFDEVGDEVWGPKSPDHVPVAILEATDDDIVCSDDALARAREALQRDIACS